mgnify:CR=1 FL=1
MSDIEDAIEQAMREGKFDHLPGKGKPLKLEDQPNEDPEWRLAHHVLKNSGFTLPWIEARQEIEAEIEAARQALQRAWEWRKEALDRQQPNPASEAEWQRARRQFGERVEQINRRIFDYNLQAPTMGLQLRKLNLERELRSLSGE